jgi:hypothetical protein
MKFPTYLRLIIASLVIGTTATTIQAEPPPFEVEVGTVLPTEKGLYYSRGDAGYLNVRIEDDQFKVVFLDSDKLVVAPENIVEVLLFVESVRGEYDRENYLLNSTKNGLVYTHPRFIEKPYYYQVKVRVSTSRQISTASTASGYMEDEKVEEYGFSILDQ